MVQQFPSTLTRFCNALSAKIVLRILAIVLFASASLKLAQYSTSRVILTDHLQQPAILLSAAGFELFLSAWFVSGIQRRGAIHIGIVVFSGFALISAAEWTFGKKDCGCFGTMGIAPWKTTAADLTFIAMLMGAARPKRTISNTGIRVPSTLRWVLLGAGVLGAFITPTIAVLIRPTLTEQLGTERFGTTMVLNAARWVGKPFPMTADIDLDGTVLNKGTCRVVFIHRECSVCTATLPGLKREADVMHIRTFLIEIAPENTVGGGSGSDVFGLPIAHLKSKRAVVANTPVVIDIVEGIVRGEWTGIKAAERWKI